MSKFFLGKLFSKSKVSPTIKSVKPSPTVMKKGVKASVDKTKSDEYIKRIRLKDSAEGKIKTGKKLVKEGVKARENLVDTRRAFKFQGSSKAYPIDPKRNPEKEYKNLNLLKKDKPQKKFKKGKELREKKMGGGMMGRRMGYSQGSSKGKVPTTPKEKSLAKLAPPKDKITFGDVVAGRTKGKRMQAKNGLTGDTELNKKLKNLSNSLMKVDRRGKPEDFMRKGKEDPMRDRKKQPLKQKNDRSRKIGINTYRRKP